MNKDNYHEQGNIIIMLILLPLGHISNIDLVWPTRLIFLAMGDVLCDGFDLAVVNPSDRKGHDMYLYRCH